MRREKKIFLVPITPCRSGDVRGTVPTFELRSGSGGGNW